MQAADRLDRPAVVIVGARLWESLRAAVEAAGFEPLRYEGQAGYVARLADDRASLILIDADDSGDPGWRFWAVTPKASPATRRIPVIVISESAERRGEALAAGANMAFSLTEVRDQVSQLIGAWARIMPAADSQRLEAQCADPLPADGLEAIRRFNSGEYYKQHDLFEALWVAETGPVRDLYRSVLQVGVAYYQITRGNHRGALKMLLRSLQWLGPLPDVCQGIDIEQLRADAARVRAELERLGEARIAEFDHALLRPVRLVSDDSAAT